MNYELDRGRLTTSDFERLIEYRQAPVTRYAVSGRAKRGIRLHNRSHKRKQAGRAPTESRAIRNVLFTTTSEGW
jgi:hypothetical protein